MQLHVQALLVALHDHCRAPAHVQAPRVPCVPVWITFRMGMTPAASSRPTPEMMPLVKEWSIEIADGGCQCIEQHGYGCHELCQHTMHSPHSAFITQRNSNMQVA